MFADEGEAEPVSMTAKTVVFIYYSVSMGHNVASFLAGSNQLRLPAFSDKGEAESVSITAKKLLYSLLFFLHGAKCSVDSCRIQLRLPVFADGGEAEPVSTTAKKCCFIYYSFSIRHNVACDVRE